VNAKALSTYMGHANISITLDRYGHLMPGNEEEAAGLLDSYLTAHRNGRTSRRVVRLANLLANRTPQRPGTRSSKPSRGLEHAMYHI